MVPQKKTVRTIFILISSHLYTMNFSRGTDPLVHYGRHFGRTVHSLCTVSAILTNGLIRLAGDSDTPDEDYPIEYV